MITAIKVIDELMDALYVDEPDPDIINDSFLPSIESNPYSLQCMIDWIYNIENHERIIELDFEVIEQDLRQLKVKYGDKVKGLFYPNWQPMKYIYECENYKYKNYDQSIYDQSVAVVCG